MASKESEPKSFIRDQVRAFKKVRHTYKLMARLIDNILSKATNDLDILAIVQSRPKKFSSFAEKCIRRLDDYPDPINMFDDLCGGRVVVPTTKISTKVMLFCRCATYFEQRIYSG